MAEKIPFNLSWTRFLKFKLGIISINISNNDLILKPFVRWQDRIGFKIMFKHLS